MAEKYYSRTSDIANILNDVTTGQPIQQNNNQSYSGTTDTANMKKVL